MGGGSGSGSDSDGGSSSDGGGGGGGEIWASDTITSERTTNACEAFYFNSAHPHIYNFLDTIIQTQTSTYLKMNYTDESDNVGEMSPGSSTESYPAFAQIGLRENPEKNLNQVTCPDRDSNPGHLVSRPDVLTVTPQERLRISKDGRNAPPPIRGDDMEGVRATGAHVDVLAEVGPRKDGVSSGKKHFRHILLFEFNIAAKAAEAARNICAVYGKNAIGESCKKTVLSFQHTTPRTKVNVHPQKMMIYVRWDKEGVVYCKFIPRYVTIIADICYQQLRRLAAAIEEKRPERFNQHDNARPQSNNMTKAAVQELD
ncbi:hypothetical protein ANN_18601 [Periplaneta americana]|uniref:Mos1 transposase HTH domain-containing protein n=1 Tax=Periplaneta americana TaxID=6978 RepID=A0ABQ8SQK0_PERAM|nr:hypothetical protein ANN_18601 [Periplaneta americana]